MNEDDRELVRLLEEQIALEKKTLVEISDAEQGAQDTPVRLLYLELRLDTWKHIKFLESIVEMVRETPCDSWSAKIDRYIDRVKLERRLRQLKESEGGMFDLVTRVLRRTDDPVATLLLTHLRDDEERHVADLDEMCRMIQGLPLQPRPGTLGRTESCA